MDAISTGRTIGELARAAGVHVETVRYYERIGLLKQPRRASGWRRYGEDALRTLRFVKRAQELGFSLEEARELLSLRASASARACARVRATAEAKIADVDARIRDLTTRETTMADQRTIEIFAAGCSACQDVIELVNRIAAPGSSIRVLDMHDAHIAARAKTLGIKSVPSVVIDGKLASCCAARGVDDATLRSELA